MSDSQTNFTLTDPAIEPIDLNRMDEFLFSAMLRASIHHISSFQERISGSSCFYSNDYFA